MCRLNCLPVFDCSVTCRLSRGLRPVRRALLLCTLALYQLHRNCILHAKAQSAANSYKVAPVPRCTLPAPTIALAPRAPHAPRGAAVCAGPCTRILVPRLSTSVCGLYRQTPLLGASAVLLILALRMQWTLVDVSAYSAGAVESWQRQAAGGMGAPRPPAPHGSGRRHRRSQVKLASVLALKAEG